MHSIRQRGIPEVRNDFETKLAPSDTITFHLDVVESSTWVMFCVVDMPVGPVLLEKTLIDRFIKLMH